MVKKEKKASVGRVSASKEQSAANEKGNNKGVRGLSHSLNGKDGLLCPAGPFNEMCKDSAYIILIKDIKGYYTHANVLYNSGSNPYLSEVIGKTDFDLFPADIAHNISRNVDRKVVEKEETVRIDETKLLAGKMRTYEVFSTPLRGKNGTITGLCRIIKDITAQKNIHRKSPEYRELVEELVGKRTQELEKANKQLQDEINNHRRIMQSLEESELSFRLMAESTKHLIMRIRFTPVFKIEYVSPAVEAITGYTAEEFSADSFINLKRLYPDDLPLFKKMQSTFYTPMTLRWIRKDGRIVWCEEMCMPFCDKNGNVIGIQVVSRDVTDRMKADEELKESQEFLMAMIHNINDAIMLFYLDTAHKPGKFIEVNEAVCKMLGYDRDELLQMEPLSLYATGEETWSPASQVMEILRSGRRAVFDGVLLTRDGGTVPVEVSAYLFEFRNKPAVVAVASDLSKCRKKNKRKMIG
jgi:PAS domain S-box-containing protein